MSAATSYHLVPPPAAPEVPTLDVDQQRVVDHPGGPLLVLAGPGTGKTTTLVEAIAGRIEDGSQPRPGPGADVQPQGGRAAARPGHRAGRADHVDGDVLDVPLLRLRPDPRATPRPSSTRRRCGCSSAPEQDVVLRELLTDNPESVDWPESLGRALGTRGFAREVHAVLSRAREKGLDGEQLRALGEREGLPELVAAGLFLDQYLTNLDHQGATDYADLIRRATIEAEAHRDELRARFRHVFVDEYQDTDPGQVALLRAIAGDGRDLTVVGDPHQSIYGFRGAEVRGILDFPTEFPRADGAPRRRGRAPDHPPVRPPAAASPPSGSPAGSACPARSRRGSRGLPRARWPRPGAWATGRVSIRTFDTERAEAEHLADLLRRAHLEDGVAVGRDGGPGAFRPYVDPAAATRARRCRGAGRGRQRRAAAGPRPRGAAAARRAAGGRQPRQRRHRPCRPHRRRPGRGAAAQPARRSRCRRPPAARPRCCGPARRTAARPRSGPPLPSRELVRRAVVEDGFLADLEGPEARPRPARSPTCSATARAQLAEGATSRGGAVDRSGRGTGWPRRLRRSVELGGGPARRAHRDLDAICALFDVAARAEERRDHIGVRAFLPTLVAQQIPADTLAERGARGAAVRLLTAHRAKGLEWRLVVVAHVQQEGWPDLRRRSTLLQADRIGSRRAGAAGEPRELLAEERRLFYVACTRARQRLVVTAVRVARGRRRAAVPVPRRARGQRRRTSSAARPGRCPWPAWSASCAVPSPTPTTSEPLRDAAARRLARLAAESVGTRPLVPAADPSTWWGTRAATRSVQPVRDPDQPVPVSASMLESLGVCPTQWFLEREAGGVARAHQSANLGELLHALAAAGRDRRARGRPRRRRPADGPRRPGLGPPRLPDPVVEAAASTSGSGRRWGASCSWHHANPRRLLGHRGAGSPRWSSSPTASRSASPATPTGSSSTPTAGWSSSTSSPAAAHPTQKSVEGHVQLGLYQYAVDSGAVDDLLPGQPGRGRRRRARAARLSTTARGRRAAAGRAGRRRPGAHRPAHAAGPRGRVSLRAESFPAVAGDHCRDCDFVPHLPGQERGGGDRQ